MNQTQRNEQHALNKRVLEGLRDLLLIPISDERRNLIQLAVEAGDSLMSATDDAASLVDHCSTLSNSLDDAQVRAEAALERAGSALSAFAASVEDLKQS